MTFRLQTLNFPSQRVVLGFCLYFIPLFFMLLPGVKEACNIILHAADCTQVITSVRFKHDCFIRWLNIIKMVDELLRNV